MHKYEKLIFMFTAILSSANMENVTKNIILRIDMMEIWNKNL